MMKLTNRSLTKFSLGFLIIASFGIVASAGARSLPASAGRPVIWSDGPCFGMGMSVMKNNCSTVRRYELPLTIDSSGQKNVSVTAQGPSAAGTVICRVAGTNSDMTSVFESGDTGLPYYGPPSTIQLRTYVWANGRLFVGCDVYPGGSLLTVNWDQ